MRSIVLLSLVLAGLLFVLGPEGGPEACGDGGDRVCLERGRLEVRVRGSSGRSLGGGAAGFGFADPDDLDVVVRIEPARFELPQGGERLADRIFIGSLSEREIWVEVKDRDLDRTRVYHRPAGTGWGLVDLVPRSTSQGVDRLASRVR